MPRDPRYWEQPVLSEDNAWFWSPPLVSDINCNITEHRSPATPFAYRIEDKHCRNHVFCATVTVRDERNGRLVEPHSSAVVPVCSFVSRSILPKLHSLPNMRRLVLEPPTNLALYSRYKVRVLDNIRHFLGFFGLLKNKETYDIDSAALEEEYTETLPVLHGHTLLSIVLPLDLRDGLDNMLQYLFQHRNLFSVEFTRPITFSPSNVHPAILASYICPSTQTLQSMRNITITEELVCVELLHVLSTFPNLAKIRVISSPHSRGGPCLIELLLSYGYTTMHFSSLRHLVIGVQRIPDSSLAQLAGRFPGVRIS